MTIKNYQKSSVELTPEIRERLKALQQEKNFTNEQISSLLKVPLNTYKNWFRQKGAKGSVSTLKERHIIRLIEIYDCSRNYLLCKSNSDNDSGSPFIFEINELYLELTNFLKANSEITIQLHQLLVSAPQEVQKIMVNRLDIWAKELKVYNLLFGDDNPIKDSYELLAKAVNPYCANITDATLSLASANFNFSKKRYEDAFPKYLKIVYNATESTKPITKEALKKILQLEIIWEEYPSALKGIFSENYEQILLEEQKRLEEQKKLEEQKTPEERKILEEQRKLAEQKRLEDPIERAINNQDFSVLPKEYYKSIYKYFQNYGIELQSLDNYLLINY